MVAEAVAEAKGEIEPEPASVAIDVPGDAHLPADYVEAEDARLEGYRKIAAARQRSQVEDVANEWVDRYGPLPPPAEGLLELARLRATCLRIGIGELSVLSGRGSGRPPVARITGIKLAASAEARLHRLARDASYREQLGQLVVPITEPARAARQLRELLDALVPDEGGETGADSMPGA
jgi:transcription-repair coupling factor (superfamily II helicase)